MSSNKVMLKKIWKIYKFENIEKMSDTFELNNIERMCQFSEFVIFRDCLNFQSHG